MGMGMGMGMGVVLPGLEESPLARHRANEV